MTLADQLVYRIRELPEMTGVPVRSYSDDADENEQVVLRPVQGYSENTMAPVFSVHIDVRTRAIGYRRAEDLCVAAFDALRWHIPNREGGAYVHAPPLVSMSPGYIGDDERGRPVYGFTLVYAVTPDKMK